MSFAHEPPSGRRAWLERAHSVWNYGAGVIGGTGLAGGVESRHAAITADFGQQDAKTSDNKLIGTALGNRRRAAGLTPCPAKHHKESKLIKCENCQGLRWVCENHKDQPWDELLSGGCECGAGEPCNICNYSPTREHTPAQMPGFIPINSLTLH